VATAPEGDQDQQNALMARSGVESARVVFSWSAAQPQPGVAPDLSETDALVARMTRRGIRVLPVVINTPVWARRYPDLAGSPPLNPNDYADYLRALIARYGPSGSFWAEHPELPKRPLREWQIWNEPHLDGFWASPDSPWQRTYTDFLRVAHDTVKQADPGAKVVLAALADFSWRHLQKIYDAGGRGLFDVMTMNFYTARPSNEVRAVRKVRKVLKRNHNSRMPVWLTEIAWPAAKGRDKVRAKWQRAWYQTDKGMAKRLTQAYAVLVKYRRSLRLGRVYWYTWSSGYKKGDLFNFGGLLRYNGAIFVRKPALKAYQRSAKRYEGCAKASTGRCR
jgi:polysaccharide biosynthesis protein PslG